MAFNCLLRSSLLCIVAYHLLATTQKVARYLSQTQLVAVNLKSRRLVPFAVWNGANCRNRPWKSEMYVGSRGCRHRADWHGIHFKTNSSIILREIKAGRRGSRTSGETTNTPMLISMQPNLDRSSILILDFWRVDSTHDELPLWKESIGGAIVRLHSPQESAHFLWRGGQATS